MGKKPFIIILSLLGMVPVLRADITSVVVTPADPDAGITNTHVITFNVTASNPPPDDGRLVIDYFGNGFNIQYVYVIEPTGHNLPVPVIASDNGSEVIIDLQGPGGGSIPAGPYWINVRSVINTQTTGSYYVHMKAQDNGGIDVGTGVNSANFTITPGAVASFTMSGVPGSRQAGQPFASNIVVTAYDQYNNLKTDYSGPVDWTSTDPYPADVPIGDGSGWSSGQKTFNAADFVLYTTPSQTITVADNANPGASETSGSITVTQASLNDYTLSGGTSQTAGIPFLLQVSNAQDGYGNAWSGTATISIFSGGGNAPRGDPPVLSDISVSNGSGSASEMLTRATTTVFQGNAGGVIRYSPGITVSAGILDDFVFTPDYLTQTAGVGFLLSVSGAQDSMWNAWSGTVFVDATTGGNAAPDGTPPTLNDVPVVSGTGSSIQTLTRRENTVLRGQADGISRSTGSIDVGPGAFAEFDFTGYPETITAGDPFPNVITISAYDAFRNIKTDYTGTIYFSSTDPQAQLTFFSGNPYTFVPGDLGVRNFPNVAFQLRTAGAQKITVLDAGAGISEQTNSIIVSHADITDFVLSLPDGASQRAGVAFRLAVSGAHDAYGNNWSGSIDVSPLTGGGNSPNTSTPIFNPIYISSQTGAGQAYQVLVNAESGVVLQAQVNGIIRSTPAILVSPNLQLASIKIRDADNNGGSEVGVLSIEVGEVLVLYAAGYDAYGNYRGNEGCNWTSSGLTPPVVGTNTGEVTYIPIATGDGTVTAVDFASGSISDHTGTISVKAGAVAGFEIGTINSPQEVGQPFIISVTAVDSFGVRVNEFNGRVAISDSSGTIQPDTSSYFIEGFWTGGVTISDTRYNNRITVTEVSGAPSPPSDSSNVFDVIPVPSIQIDSLVAVQVDTQTVLNTVTAGQNRDWFVKFFVQNIGSTQLTLENTELQFVVGGTIETDYVLDMPGVFWGNGTNILSPGESDSLRCRIGITGAKAGPATVYGTLQIRNLNGDLVDKQAWITLDVQTPADVVISKIRRSQPEVSQGQEEDWQLTMILKNNGGSSVFIDSNEVSTYLTFNRGDGWIVSRPLSMVGGGWELTGGETDSLLFVVQKTGSGPAGTCYIHGFTSGTEINTGNSVSTDTDAQGYGWATVKLQRPADLHILSVVSNAPNAPYVDINQIFTVQVNLSNAGDDAVRDAHILIRSDGNSIYLPVVPIEDINGGSSFSVDVTINASYLVNSQEVFTFEATGIAENTNSVVGSEERNLGVAIQNPAIMNVGQIRTTVDSVIGGQIDPWYVKVTIYNNGQAGFIFDTPNANDLVFYNNGLNQSDYKVKPPTGLKSGGLILNGGTRDTLIYTVQSTGRLGGKVTVRARISGRDRNSLVAQKDSSDGSVYVKSETDFRIISTQVVTYHLTDAGNGYVNTMQPFQIRVGVENGLGETLEQIQIRLRGSGSSTIADTIKTLSKLKPSQEDSVTFDLVASSVENLNGEKFTASIIQAMRESTGLSISAGEAIDSTAKVIIQSPADIDLDIVLENASGQFSAGQEFTVSAQLSNNGSSQIDNSGRVRIIPPSNYILLSAYDSSAISATSPAHWILKAPSVTQPSREMTVFLYQYPLDVNTGEAAQVSADQVTVNVSTISSSLVSGLSVTAPDGARDRVVSTDQEFIVLANFQMQNVTDIRAKLTLPSGYTTDDDFEKSVPGSIVTWKVKAPSEPSALSLIELEAYGEDAMQPGIGITAKKTSIDITTVWAADLVLTLSIIDPADAIDGTVSPGQEFTVQAEVQNNGEADIEGQGVVMLSSLPDDYLLMGDGIASKVLENNRATWLIQAPVQATGTETIEVSFITVPQDINTSAAAKLSRGNDKIGVTVESTWLAVAPVQLPEHLSRSSTTGQNWTKLMILEFANKGKVGANRIKVESISMLVEDMQQNEIPPNHIFSRISIVNEEDTLQIFGGKSPLPSLNPVTISGMDQLLVSVEENTKIAIIGEIAKEKEETYFQLNIPAPSSIVASLDEGVDVLVADEAGKPFENLRSAPQRILNPETENLLWNSPNPFGQMGKEITYIGFYVETATTVDLKLYTLTGKLVWSLSLTEEQLEGAVGSTYQVPWDGRNDSNNMVLNGVYILFMKTGDGKIRKTKVAVMK